MKLKNPLKKKQLVRDNEETDIIDADFHAQKDGTSEKKRIIPKIKNPITEMKRKQEEEKRRKEEELRRKREQEEHERKQAFTLLVGMGIVSFILLGVMSLNDRETPKSESVAVVEPTPEVITTPPPQPITTPTPPSIPVSGHTPSADAGSAETEEVTELSQTAEPTPLSTQTLEPNPYHRLDNMSVSARTDYGHFAEGTIIQGNGETFYVVIDTKNKDANEDDVVMYYDDTEINVLSKDFYSEGLGYPRVEYHCQAVKEGEFEVQIASSYDDYNYEQTGKDFNCYYLNIKKLGWRDGQVVYLSYSGEKYHKSSVHAGDSWTAVTLWDAESMGIEPCGTCY